MKMMTKKIEQALPKLGATEKVPAGEKKVIVKFFCPWSNWTWYVYEGHQMENGDWEFFGLVEGLDTELGYFLLSQLTEVSGPGGLKIERDLYVGASR